VAAVWNHNIEYFPLVLGLVGEKPRATALDVGSGDGMLAAQMAAAAPRVVGLDADAESVAIARTRYADVAGLTFETGDVLTTDVTGAPFDVVTCSATLHHLPLEAGLTRLRELTAPGGTLIVVGLALESTPGDYLLSAVSVLPNRILRAARGFHRHGSPTADPQETYSAIRSTSRRLLPGSRFHRHLYWRYSLVWDRPLG
jgi:16S rRNA G1207 methylase RsmC